MNSGKTLRNLSIAVIACTAFLSLWLVVFRLPSRSEVLELRHYEVETIFPAMSCLLGQHNSLRGYLEHEGFPLSEPVIVTADDENAIVLLHGRNIQVIRFTTFRFKLEEFGCRRL